MYLEKSPHCCIYIIYLALSRVVYCNGVLTPFYIDDFCTEFGINTQYTLGRMDEDSLMKESAELFSVKSSTHDDNFKRVHSVSVPFAFMV